MTSLIYQSEELKIRGPCSATLNIVAEIKHYPCKKINNERKSYRNKRSVNKKQPDFGDRNIKALAQVGTYPKGITFKKGQYPL
jgi:hypothetical protein